MIYFASDVHLGLRQGNPAERERAFASWLSSIPPKDPSDGSPSVLWLLGDIWDFWYEYHDVIPKEGIRVISALVGLVDKGVEIHYIPGNHDIWCYHFFESIGIRKEEGPCEFDWGGKHFFVAHGDCLAKARRSYALMLRIFRNKVCQALFSTIHPRLAFRFGTDWSKNNRKTHPVYIWKGKAESLYQYALAYNAEARNSKVDIFVFGHLHVRASEILPDGSRLEVLDSWISPNPEGSEAFLSFDRNF